MAQPPVPVPTSQALVTFAAAKEANAVLTADVAASAAADQVIDAHFNQQPPWAVAMMQTLSDQITNVCRSSIPSLSIKNVLPIL